MTTETNDPNENASFEGAKLAAELAATGQEIHRLPEMLTAEDIKANLPEIGGTEIILQRHGKYVRDTDDPRVGSLTAESEQDQVDKGHAFISDLIAQLPEDERDSLDVFIVASDTQYGGGGRRSFETAQAVQRGMTTALESAGLGSDHILNNVNPARGIDGSLQTGEPRATPSLREPSMFYNEEFNKFLTDKYGPKTLAYFIAFEEDQHAEERLAMGAEGPDDIADRTLKTVEVLSRYSDVYHAAHPGRRLIIWAATHYDTISPLVRLKLAGGTKTDALMVDYGAGISIDITPNGHATSTIAGTSYDVPLAERR